MSNTRNEINRLLNVMKEDKENMNKLKDEYNDRLVKEEEEREKLNVLIKQNEEKIEILNDKNNELDANNNEKYGLFNNGNNNIFENDLDGNEHKKDFQIKKLKEVVLNLQIKICNLKKEINNNNDEMQKLNKVLKYKNMKDELQRININNLFYTVEENEINAQRSNIILKNKDEIIKKLNGSILNKNEIKRNIIKKLPKSSSQILLFNKKADNL